MDRSSNKYAWFARGDLNGFFGLMFDNLTVLSFLAGTLVLVFKFPADIVYTKMFPGTAFGVLVGDLDLHVDGIPPRQADRKSDRHGNAARARYAVHDRDGARRPGTRVRRIEGRRDGGARCRDDDLVHRHGHHGHHRPFQSRLLVHRAVGPASGAAGRAPGLAGGYRSRLDRSRAGGGCVQHAGDRDAVTRPDSLFARGAHPAAGQLSQRARRNRARHGPLLHLRGDRLDGRHVRRTTPARSALRSSCPDTGIHERVHPGDQLPGDLDSIRSADGSRAASMSRRVRASPATVTTREASC